MALPPTPEQPTSEELVSGEPQVPGSPPASPRQIAWTRRRRTLASNWRIFANSRMGIVGLVALVAFVLVALTAPFFVDPEDLDPNDPQQQSVPAAPIKPSMLITEEYIDEYIEINTNGGELAEKWRAELDEMAGTWRFPLGTDSYGRSSLDLLIWGSRASLVVGVVATLMTMVLGAGIGICGGFFRGKTDMVLSRFTDWFLVLPWVPLAIVLASLLGPSMWNIILIIGATSWAATARLVRSEALTVSTRPYVEHGRALGASSWHIITRHVLPNIMSIILASTVLTVAYTILSEAYLAFLGLGDPASLSWGTILDQAREAGALTGGYWWYVFPPGLAITFTVLAFTLVGVAIEEITDPKLRDR